MTPVFHEHDISSEFISVWQRILDVAAGILQLSAVNIMIRNGDELEVLVSSDHSCTSAERFPLGWTRLCARVIETGRPLMAEDFSSEPDYWNLSDLVEGGVAVMVLPLFRPDREPFGAICVFDNAPKHLSDAHRMLLEFFRDLIEKDLVAMAECTLLVSENEAYKETEKILRQYTSGLEIRNAELDTYAQTVAHELKGPLSGILLSAENLMHEYDQLSSIEVKRDLRAIFQATQRMNGIVVDLLMLARLRQKKTLAVPLEMKRIVVDALERLSPLVKKYEAKIELPVTWPVALGYGPWVEEVWVNYVSNAIKYGGRPPLIKIATSMSSNGMVHFSVRDNGNGLKKEELNRLFVPFYRAGRTGGKGDGLGLSIARRITERLHGTVHVESEEGKGSIFAFSLPAAI